MGPTEAADVHHTEVIRCHAGVHPRGQCHPRSPTGGNTKCIESGTHEEVLQLRRLTKNEVAVRGETLGAVDEFVDARILQRRDTSHGQFHDGGEVVKVGLQQLKLKRTGDTAHSPRHRIGLIAPHHQRAYFFLVVREAIGVAQRW